MSLKQIEANRNNSLKSTGPKTKEGKAAAKMNAMKHGILCKQAVMRGFCIQERPRHFKALRERFWEHYAPVGPAEETLVDEIVTTRWRLRRALTAETGEIAHSVDSGWWWRSRRGMSKAWEIWSGLSDPALKLMESSAGIYLIMQILARAWLRVKKDGELTEETLQCVAKEFYDKPNSIVEKLKDFRAVFDKNPDALDPDALKAKHQQDLEKYFADQFDDYLKLMLVSKEREKKQEQSLQMAAVLPSAKTVDKILRYETTLDRKLYRAMHELERLQRMRKGENVPPPLTMEVSHKC